MSAPTLATERLTLRPIRYDDFPAYATFLATDRAWGMGGPHGVRTAWEYFCNDTAQWTLLGMGGLMIVPHGTDAPAGQVAVCHGPIFPEPELGWFLYAGQEGKGYATEAARAMRDWAFDTRGLTTLVSYIDPVNTASVRVAERLGGVRDPDAATPFDEPDLVFRHSRGARR
jgi:RimJ/RimL family protein N-acetyltransferase